MNLKNKFLRYLLFLVVTFGLTDLKAETNRYPPEGLNYIFESGSEGYDCFRIPAIAVTTRGTILAFAEGRKGGCSDTGNIDIVLKRSYDNGFTWTDLQVVWNNDANTCGNPAPVVDEETGDIFLLTTWNLGTDHEREIIDQTSEDSRRVYLMSSSDDGQTWSEARDITGNVKDKSWTWYATGPGSGIQLKNRKFRGRLVIPCDHIEAGSKKYYSHVIYSDDHGKTWRAGGRTPQDQVNECMVVELSNGDLMLNMRNYDRSKKSRQISISKDGGMSWSDLYHHETLIEPVCQASLISHQFADKKKRCLIFSNPAHETKRVNMTVRASYDNGKTWPLAKVVHPGPSAYSDLASLSNGNIVCLHEGGYGSAYEGIAVQILSLEDFEAVND